MEALIQFDEPAQGEVVHNKSVLQYVISYIFLVYFFRSWWDAISKSKAIIVTCSLLFITFVIASLIILSLIPLYLPKKQFDGIVINGSMFMFLFVTFYFYCIIDL